MAVDVTGEDDSIGIGTLGESPEDSTALDLVSRPLVHRAGELVSRSPIDAGHHHLLREDIPTRR